MWPNPNVDVQVAMGTTARTSCATARETQRGAIVDARRDLHGVRALLNGTAGRIACRTRIEDHLPEPAARTARTGGDHLPEYRIADPPNLTGTTALLTDRRRSSVAGTRTVAILTPHGCSDRDLLVGAEHHLFEIKIDVSFEVLTARGPAPGLTATTENRATPKEGLKDVAQAATERVGGRAVFAVAVVGSAALWIAERLVRGADFLEASLGFRIAGVEVGVVGAGEFLVGPLDLIVGSAARHPQRFVVIGHQPSFSSRSRRLLTTATADNACE